MFFQIIETSSAGNCAYAECEGIRFLIDAGVGIKKIRGYLSKRGLDILDIDAVFVTHEHIDHYRALKNFKGSNAKIFANRLTAESIQYLDSATKCLDWRIFSTGEAFDFMGIKVSSFPIPHDTSDAVGYRFDLGGKTLVWVTDIGKLTLSVRDIASHAQILVLESNYCPRMLDNSNRPYSLKMRIKGSHGHLSNSDAISLIEGLDSTLVDKVYLAHISRECNSVSHINELLSGIAPSIRTKIEIVPPLQESSPFDF